MRWLILLHRYLGIAIGWLLVAWCLSGVVMMYVAYPEVSFEEHVDTLPELDLGTCCALDVELSAETELERFAVEMLGTVAVARLEDSYGRQLTLDIASGRSVDYVDDRQAQAAAEALGPPDTTPVLVETLDSDQWTVTANFNRDRPLYRFELGDDAGTEWYLSSSTGQLVQATTARERFWNWLGAVVHWLYPAVLRAHGPLWSQVVIWTSLLGAFLTGFGLFIGIKQLRRRRNGRWSPYRGLALWHHWLGVVFGALALTWVSSGLLSMNPWGLLESGSARDEVERLRAERYTVGDAARWLEAIDAATLPPGTKRLESAPFRGKPFLIAYDGQGHATRLAADTATPAPLSTAELAAAARALVAEPVSAELLHAEDSYYFSHHVLRPLPVYRVVAADATRYYLDPVSGRLIAKFDQARRNYRWLFEAAHRLDFHAVTRQRPVWDVLMIVLLTGVTAVCATGTYLGFRYLRR